MRSVHEWLRDSKKSYAEGVAILKEARPKDSAFFEKVSNAATDSYHFRMLISKLQNVARIQLQNPVKKETAIKSTVKVVDIKKATTNKATTNKTPTKGKNDSVRITSNPTVDFKLLPEDLQEKYLRNKDIVKEMAQNQVEMKAADTDEKRKSFMDKLTALETEKKENWKDIDEWWAGNKPEEKVLTDEEKIAQKVLEKSRRIETLKINISRGKKELDKLQPEKRAKKEEKIASWEKELSDLQK